MKAQIKPESDIAQTLGLDPSSARKKSWRRWYIPAILAMVVIGFVIWRTGGKSDSARYLTREVEKGDMTVIVTATGTLEPTNTVQVGSELSGIIKSITVDYNDNVKVGQILAELDTTKLATQVTQSRAALAAAKAKVLQAQATVKETRSVLGQYNKVWTASGGKVPSQIELDAAEAELARAEADAASANAAVSQAEATLEGDETDLAKSVIRSPINGIVLSRSIESGQTVSASFEAPVLFTLAEDLAKMELHVNVDEADIGKVREGQDATFSVAAYPDRTFQARITQARYGSSATSGVVTYETILKVENTDLSLRPGMTATADIIVKKIEGVLLVPSTALRFAPPVMEEKSPSTGLVGSILPHPPNQSNQKKDDSVNAKQQRVWTLKEGQLVAIPITTGETDGTWTEVLSGDVTAGLKVVVDTEGAAE